MNRCGHDDHKIADDAEDKEVLSSHHMGMFLSLFLNGTQDSIRTGLCGSPHVNGQHGMAT